MKKVIIIGGGVAGMQAAATLRELGIDSLILEKEETLGGKLVLWDRLFPVQTPASDVLGRLEAGCEGVPFRLGTEVVSLKRTGGRIEIDIKDGDPVYGDAVLVSTGFDIFDAALKEEYGYGLYPNVITSVDLEQMSKQGRIVTAGGDAPHRVAFLHCVGSRDEKVRQMHCSRVCCVTGVKQAIEIKEAVPDCEIFNFYMDMRMFGGGYEELYKEAQIKYGINFIRGRISEAGETIDGRIQLKAEDTLAGRPLRMTVDLFVLLVGFVAPKCYATLGLPLKDSGFLQTLDPFTGNLDSAVKGVFLAGTSTTPKNIGETINEARSVAMKIRNYLNQS